jgi:DNA-binding response OmpR family regulator
MSTQHLTAPQLQTPVPDGPAIAVIEDSAPLRDNMVMSLTASGKLAWGCESAEGFYRECCLRRPHILLVDLGLPGENGISLIQHLSQTHAFGIIVVTARGDDDSHGAAMTAGADHYFVKPVKFPQLLGAIDALWRRISQTTTPASTALPWLFDAVACTLRSPSDVAMGLSASEAALLACFCRYNRQIIGKVELCASVFGTTAQSCDGRIDVLVSRLRSKAKDHGVALPLRSIFGKGLSFVEPIIRR